MVVYLFNHLIVLIMLSQTVSVQPLFHFYTKATNFGHSRARTSQYCKITSLDQKLHLPDVCLDPPVLTNATNSIIKNSCLKLVQLKPALSKDDFSLFPANILCPLGTNKLVCNSDNFQHRVVYNGSGWNLCKGHFSATCNGARSVEDWGCRSIQHTRLGYFTTPLHPPNPAASPIQSKAVGKLDHKVVRMLKMVKDRDMGSQRRQNWKTVALMETMQEQVDNGASAAKIVSD